MSLLTSFIPLPYRIAAIAVIVASVGGYILVLHVQVANREATIAEQGQAITTLALQRDQEAATARRNAGALAVMRRTAEAEQAARERQRRAYEAALSQRDKIIGDIRREKTARDPLPGAFRPLLGLR